MDAPHDTPLHHTPLHHTTVDGPLGPVFLAADAAGLRHISFQRGTRAMSPRPGWVRVPQPPQDSVLGRAVRQLRAYFAGEPVRFDLPLAPRGTPFQQRVWRALCEIPYGRTISYGELARRIGKPTAARAVGAANGRNPLPIVVPCHRVIGSGGSLTGFGGGLHLKEGLLKLEGVPGAWDDRQPTLL